MIEITKRGTPPNEMVWKGRCHKCGSEAKGTQDDMTHIKHDQRDGSYSWEVCPVCKAGESLNGYGGICFHPQRVTV
jgi:hypothetical protein